MKTATFTAGIGVGLLVASVILSVSTPQSLVRSATGTPTSTVTQLQQKLNVLSVQNEHFRQTVQMEEQLLAKEIRMVKNAKTAYEKGKTVTTGTVASKQAAGDISAPTAVVNGKSIRIWIASGMSITEVANELLRYKVIDRVDVFTRLAEQGPYIRAGSFILPLHGDPVSVLRILTTP